MSISENLKKVLWKFKDSRKAKVTLLVVLLLIGVTAAGYVIFGGGTGATPKNTNTVSSNSTSEETLVRRAIDGVMVPVSRANAYPLGVVIENLVAARPQAGLDEANVVFEHLAEGGITRFLAVFASGNDVPKIGPVRSARTVHLDLAEELRLLFVHAGGSPAAIQALSQSKSINDFNQFFNSQYFWRDQERRKTKALEHTLYTSSELLARALRDTNAPLVGTYDPWRFTDDAPLSERPTEDKRVTIDFSSFNYKVEWRYHPEENTYERFLGEQAHVMENGKGIFAKNIIVQYTPTKLADDQGRLDITMEGEGAAVIFQNGKAINATWKRDSAEDRTRYSDDSGDEIEFVAGTTWVEIVPDDRDVTYT